MNKNIVFNTEGYDSFIDFIKTYAIICVLFGHTFGFLLDKVAYGVWAGMQVPLFILVQAFHCYKKDLILVDIKKVFKRVMIPFFILEMLTFFVSLLIGNYDSITLVHIALSGGYGPGAYFPWVFFQIAILIPLFSYVLKKFNKSVSLFFFVVICEVSELFFSFIGISENLYRLLAMRYVFLLYFGWVWAKEGIKINRTTILLSLISLVSIIYFEYYSVNDEPWFFKTGFSTHRWPCYYFVAYLFVAFLNLMWRKFMQNEIILKCVKVLAKSTYEIFLIQMSLIFIFPSNGILFISSDYLRIGVWMMIVWFISIYGGILLNKTIHPQRKRIQI